MAQLEVPLSEALVATDEPFDPFRLVDATGKNIEPAAAYFAELLACVRSAKTLRSYGMDLLRWFRFLSALEMEWDHVTRLEGRDFGRSLQTVRKPVRPHWRHPEGLGQNAKAVARTVDAGPGFGITPESDRYAAVTVAHCESVLRSFYDFHLESRTRPMLNPFPLAQLFHGGPHGHRNPDFPVPGSHF